MTKQSTSGIRSDSRLLAVAGPTACGKSAIALALAREVAGEIVSCDSVQVYRGFAIGCAKPTREERAMVPHHLLDVARWDEPFDAQQYRHAALDAIAAIRGRGRMPVLCGGTGLYLRTLRWGLVDAPPADLDLRAQLYAEEVQTPGTLHARLGTVDPVSAQHIGPKNLVHLVRALEISLRAGEPASQLRARHGFAQEEVPMRLVAIDRPTPVLRARITQRVDAMLAQGLLAEVEGLLAAGVPPNARPMRSVGYKEASEVVLGISPPKGLADRIVRATLAYARRQRTWLRREQDVEWLRIDTDAEEAAAVRSLHSSVES